MERGLYIAASGMLAEMARQDQLANDLANASTPGYKADRVSQRSFGDLMLSNSTDGSTVGPLGQGAAIDKQVTDLRPQALQRHRPAARPRGRRRRLLRRADQAGRALHAQRLVRGRRQGQPRRPDGQPGPRRGRQADRRSPTAPIDTTKVALFNVRNPVKQGDSNFTGQAGGQATGTVKSGSLEGSGVDPARAMVDLMASMRSMEATQRAITTIDTSLQQTASQVGGLPG